MKVEFVLIINDLKYLISSLWMIVDYHVQPTVDNAHIDHENHNVDQSRGQLQA